MRGGWEICCSRFVFHAEIAEGQGRFDLDAVADGISEKLVRRHPHVFGESSAEDSDQVLKQWDEIKRGEKGEVDVPYLHGTGKGLPALVRAAKLQKKAAKSGFDWPAETGCPCENPRRAAGVAVGDRRADMAAVEEELGDLLFSVVNLARFRKIDPEVLMAGANTKFERRFGEMEKALKAAGKAIEEASVGEMEEAWLEAKAKEWRHSAANRSAAEMEGHKMIIHPSNKNGGNGRGCVLWLLGSRMRPLLGGAAIGGFSGRTKLAFSP